MKNVNKLLVVLVLVLAGCKDDEGSPATVPPGGNASMVDARPVGDAAAAGGAGGNAGNAGGAAGMNAGGMKMGGSAGGATDGGATDGGKDTGSRPG